MKLKKDPLQLHPFLNTSALRLPSAKRKEGAEIVPRAF
jgi:hypothetical protein